MTDREAFEKILDNNEEIVESFRPHRFRYIGLGIIRDIVVCAFIAGFGGLFTFFSTLDGWVDAEGNPTSNPPMFIGFIIMGIGLLILAFSVITRIVRYKKTRFCYTNKRIIIRTGFIGADYRTLDFDMIGAMDVRVDLLDKLVRPTTGTLTFASAASPMIATTSGGTSGFYFFCIKDPYDVYKRIKEYASTHKDGVLMS